MNRRTFLKRLVLAPGALTSFSGRLSASLAPETALFKDWRVRWEKNILGEIHNRYCDRESGEEIGWLISPFLNGFLHGYHATQDAKWVELFADWTESWIKRGVKEPDGFTGWPKKGTGGVGEAAFLTDSLLGEAMALRPVVLTAAEILKTPSLQHLAARAEPWLQLATQMFEKWDSRGCWRETNDGGLWVVPGFGIDTKTGNWTEGYARRQSSGFSNPDNKQNHIARWLLAMHDVSLNPVYRARAEKWFRLMKSRMKTREDGNYFVWNYWEPAGPWDYKPDGSPQHWIGVHPNGGYYGIDVEAIVTAFEHGLVFTQADMQKLISTNRDFMWNQQVNGATFQRIDGGQPDARWKDSPGVLWHALVPHDETLRKIFVANHNPDSWGGLDVTPWFLAREGRGDSLHDLVRQDL